MAASVTPVWAISCVRAEQQPVLPKPRAKAAAEMESELKPLAVASVTPVWAISCVRAEQQPVLPWPRTKAAAEMENELKLLAAARQGNQLQARQETACASQADGGLRHARQGDQL